MPKLLFIAGEPGCGKSTGVAEPLKRLNLGMVLHTDRVSKHAAGSYQLGKSLGSKWQLWKLEFDRSDNHRELETAFSRAIERRINHSSSELPSIICEGVLSGHPRFRRVIQAILSEFGFVPDNVRTLVICMPWETIKLNLKERGRPEDQIPRFIEERSKDYQELISKQVEVNCFQSSTECLEAAKAFLRLQG